MAGDLLYSTILPPPTHMYQLPNGLIHKSRKDVYDNTVKIEKCFPGFNQVKLTYVLTWTSEIYFFRIVDCNSRVIVPLNILRQGRAQF